MTTNREEKEEVRALSFTHTKKAGFLNLTVIKHLLML